MKMTVSASSNGRAAILSPYGPLDNSNSKQCTEQITELMSKGASVIIFDAAEVPYISSTGLSSLVTVHHSLREKGGFLIVTNLSVESKSIFSIIGIDKELIIESTLEAAIQTAASAGAGSFRTVPGSTIDIHTGNITEESASTSQSSPHVGSYPVPDGETIFEKPLIVECESCKALVRIHSSGRFMCPSCHMEFTADTEGTVIF